MLAAILTAYAEYVGDVLVNTCDAPAPGRVLRYHGHAPPEDLDCDADGYLAVWWEGPALAPRVQGTPCPGPLPVTLAAKWVRCWKIAQADETGITLFDATWDADAATFADAAECVSRALARLACLDADEVEDDSYLGVLLSLLGPRPSFLGVTPTGAGGGAAGLVWRLSATLGQSPVTS